MPIRAVIEAGLNEQIDVVATDDEKGGHLTCGRLPGRLKLEPEMVLRHQAVIATRIRRAQGLVHSPRAVHPEDLKLQAALYAGEPPGRGEQLPALFLPLPLLRRGRWGSPLGR